MRFILYRAFLLFFIGVGVLTAQTVDYGNILFIHQSVGNGIIEIGHMRELMSEYNDVHGTDLQLWDHHINSTGLRDPQGNYGYGNYDIPYDNTNPDGYYGIFMQPLDFPPDNAFSRMMLPHILGGDTITHNTIVFKSCYSGSDINSEQELNDYQGYYLGIRSIMDAHPEKIFIMLTPPPLVRSATIPEDAARARRFSQWLISSEFLSGHQNMFTFDLWNMLADQDSTSPNYNCLRTDYRDDPNDSHPNAHADSIVARMLVADIGDVTRTYSGVDFIPGDVNASGEVNFIDVTFFVNYLHGRSDIPNPIWRADVNGSCEVNGVDVVYLVRYLRGGPYPIRGDCDNPINDDTRSSQILYRIDR